MDKIRVGVFGAGRGSSVAQHFLLVGGVEIVAVCDRNKERVEKMARRRLGNDFVLYEDFDSFIEHPMDVCIIANNFYQHAKYVIKCFEKNIHVFCECLSNGTMKEAVELVRAYEKSKSIFMLAENAAYYLPNLEMKKIIESGKIGKVLYAEGEYNHPTNPWDTAITKRLKFYPKHWRHYIPSTYYLTHSIGPVMFATGATPKKVMAFAMFNPFPDDIPTASHVADWGASISTLNDDGSVFRVVGCSKFGGHHNSYRYCGPKGQVETVRGMKNKIMLRYNEWDKPEGEEAERLYEPAWNDKDEEFIKQSMHDGADYVIDRFFLNCVREGKEIPHPFDLHSAIAMASVAILAHRSVLSGGKTFDIPDFTKEEDRKLYENDGLSPFFGDDGSEPTIPCCSHTDYEPSENNMKLYLEELAKDVEI